MCQRKILMSKYVSLNVLEAGTNRLYKSKLSYFDVVFVFTGNKEVITHMMEKRSIWMKIHHLSES